MTNTITKITYDWNDYKVWEGYTAGTWISISASNEISSTVSWVPTVWTNGQVLTVVSWAAAWANASGWSSTITVTLASANWSSKSITVSATWVTASNTVIVSPAPSNINDYATNSVYCSAQWSGTLTFSCNTEPTSDIDVNVVILS